MLAIDDPRESFATRAVLASAVGRTLGVQHYIWHDDVTGKLLLKALREAADRGVRVRLLLDDNGIAMDDALVALHAHERIEVRPFNAFPVRTLKRVAYLWDFRRLNRRMHNKSFTADGRASVVGGRNVGDEHFGATRGTLFSDLDMGARPPFARLVPDARVARRGHDGPRRSRARGGPLVHRQDDGRHGRPAGRSIVYVDLQDSVRGDDADDTWLRVRNLIEDIRRDFPRGVVGPFHDDRSGDVYGSIHAFSAPDLDGRELLDVVEDARSATSSPRACTWTSCACRARRTCRASCRRPRARRLAPAGTGMRRSGPSGAWRTRGSMPKGFAASTTARTTRSASCTGCWPSACPDARLARLEELAGMRTTLLAQFTLLRIEGEGGAVRYASPFRNDAHRNPSTVLGEARYLAPAENTVTVMPGVRAAYPNALVRVAEGELAEFVDAAPAPSAVASPGRASSIPAPRRSA